ncbi:MAG: alpha-2-macroglobulin family protein [Hyphomicrobiaceae bacterium]
MPIPFLRALFNLLSATLVLALVAAVPAAANEPRSFSHSGVARDAERYESWLVTNWKPTKGQPQAKSQKAGAARLVASDPRAAARAYGGAVSLDPKDAEAWLGLARSLNAIPVNTLVGSERYENPVNASAAAYLAYQRGTGPAFQAAALAVLAESLKRRSFWRPAIDAYRVSLVLAENKDVRDALDALKAEHGFRVVDYKIDNEAEAPRLCVQFSERISSRQADPSKFVSVDGKDPQVVTSDGSQLCIEGLVHGGRYEVQVRAGLPSETGDVLSKTSELAVYVKDRSPSVRFTGRNYVLPSRGQQGIPVITVNTEKVDVEVFRIGDRSLAGAVANGDTQAQLSPYQLEELASRTGARVYRGTLDVKSRLNEEVTTAVPVGEAVGTLKPGVYAVVAKPTVKSEQQSWRPLATQWFVVSDYGITAFSGERAVHAFVRSLATTEALAGVKVRLIARNNDVLGEARTDSAGYVRFGQGLASGEGGAAPALLIAEGSDGADYAFLDLQATSFDLSDRGVKGRQLAGALDAFLYTDRGVYRAGETVHLAGLVRDRNGIAATVPTTLIVTRPDGVEHRRIALPDQGLGGRTLSLPLAGSAMTGTWRVRLHADPKADPLAAAAFLVEDFQPERLELTLAAKSKAITVDEQAAIDLTGRYLYGPPADDLAIEGDIVVKPATKDLEGFAGFRFGMAEEKIAPVRKALEGLPRTSKDGKANVVIGLPAIPRTARPLEADVILRLREPGGRTIERTVTLPVDTRTPSIGIRPLFSDSRSKEGQPAEFDAVLLDSEHKRVAGKALRWELARLDTSWQWYSREGQWTYEAVTLTRKIATGTVTTGQDGLARMAAKVDWGRYRLEVTADEAGGPVSTYTFYAGWYGEETAESPEQLEVALDKPSYRIGETAKLRISSRHAGKALIAVLGAGLVSHREVEIPRGGGEVPLDVGADLGPGAYVTAILYRPMDEAAKRMPSRAIGIRWLGLDQTPRTLKVDLAAPERVRPGTRLTLPIKVSGLAAGEDARVTVAAVDVGILNLTRFETPKPESWFYAQRKLGLEIRDFYGRLIDGMRADRGRLRSGGDGTGGGGLNGSPPVEETVALFSGLVTVGANGTASVTFDMPDFNGTVRLNAVAWSRDKVGHGTADVIVREAIALTASGPRYLTWGDQARLSIELHNIELPRGAVKLTVEQETASGLKAIVLDRDVALAQNERKTERLTVKPNELGLVTYAVRAAGPGLEIRRKLTFDVKPPAADIKRTTVAALAGNGGKITLSKDLLSDLIPGRTRLTLSVGPTAAMDVPGLLTQLDRYPYGCAEQTVSRALPLLYANALAVDLGLVRDTQLKERIQKAIERVFEMQDNTGAFGVWGPSRGDLWLTAYVTDFLTRAKETGYVVEPARLGQALDRLQNSVSYGQDFQHGGEARAYALYVLARNGRAPIGELRYFVDTRLDRFATPLAKAQLGAALAMMGEKERAERAFRSALESMDEKESGWRADYGSRLRDGAAIVTLAAETRTLRNETPQLAGVLSKAFSGRQYTSTQEQAWMLLAARALADQAGETRLSFGGTEVKGALNRTIDPAVLAGGDLVVENRGDARVDSVISVIGASLTPEQAIAKGLEVVREYYTLDGKPVTLESSSGGNGRMAQNDRLVAVLKIAIPQDGGRLLVVDRLPAGLQIENPRLVDSGDVKSLDWLKPALRPSHTEFRDDRFVAAFDVRPNGQTGQRNGNNADEDDEDEEDNNAAAAAAKPKGPVQSTTIAYVVRAVTPGNFVHPAATIEDMYRPERFARTAMGKLEVTGQP